MSKDAIQLEDRDGLKRRLVDALQKRTTRLRDGDEPRKVSAIVIARWLGLAPQAKHETRRRAVRTLVSELRDEGCAISSHFSGYWLAVTPEDHELHQKFLRSMGLALLVTAAKDRHAPLTEEQAGQLQLFK